MSKSNNLTDFLRDIADTLRELKGTSGTINPQNFSQEIRDLVQLPPKGQPLESYTWYQIKRIGESGSMKDYFSYGDSKSFTMGGNTFSAKFVDISYNGEGGAVFFCTTNAAVNYQVFTGEPPNNSGGWGASPLRTTLNDTLFNTIQTELKDVIKSVPVKYGNGGASTTTQNQISSVNCKLFIPSISELQGNSRANVSGYVCPGDGSDGRWNLGTNEGSQLAYFAGTPSAVPQGYVYNTRSCIHAVNYIANVQTSLQTGSNGLTCYCSRVWGTTPGRLVFLFVI